MKSNFISHETVITTYFTHANGEKEPIKTQQTTLNLAIIMLNSP